MSDLNDVIAAANAARLAYEDSCRAVWHALMLAEPELASEIATLGLEDAAKWLCQPHRNAETPAALIATGRAAEVLSAIRSSKHGFSA